MKIKKGNREIADKKHAYDMQIARMQWNVEYADKEEKQLSLDVASATENLSIVSNEVKRWKASYSSFLYRFLSAKRRNHIKNSLEFQSKREAEMKQTLVDKKTELANVKEELRVTQMELDKAKAENVSAIVKLAGCVDFKEITRQLASNAWYGVKERTCMMKCGEDIIQLHGYTYEPCYEDFTAITRIDLNKECLFGKESYSSEAYRKTVYDLGKFKTENEAIDFIEDKFDGCEVQLEYC